MEIGRPLMWYSVNKVKLGAELNVEPLSDAEFKKVRIEVYLLPTYSLSLYYFFS